MTSPDRAERRNRLFKGLLRVGNDECEILIRNISSSGIGASASGGAPPPGAEVTVMLPGGRVVSGLVRWSRGRNFGIALAEELPVDDQAIAPGEAQAAGSGWTVKSLHKVTTPRVDPARLRRI